jgi:hypothetical protein
VGVAQAPAPVQCETGVYVEPVHDAVPQDTLALACSQAPAPLQFPVLPQGGLAAQPPCGSTLPAPTSVHVPVAHVWQRPHDDDAQHTPSTQ